VANAGLALVFAGLVGALFLSVLLVITVWERRPIAGALIVSALPAAAFLVRPLADRLPRREAATGGALLLAAGLVALALLPTISDVLLAISLGFCGVGLGLAVPVLTIDSIDPEHAPLRSGTITVGARHLGLVASVALIAPLLTHSLDSVQTRATLAGTRVIMDGNIDLTKKVPIALDMRDAFQRAQSGEIPDLAKPFDDRGAKTDSSLRALRDTLLDTLRAAVSRAFRSSFFLSALFALLALIPARMLREKDSDA
jgi:small basic protein